MIHEKVILFYDYNYYSGDSNMKFKPKSIECLKTISMKQLVKDASSGCLVAVIAFPLSVALAIASGLSPEKGLYSAIIGGFFVSAFGGSKVNIGGVTAATVMTVFTIIDGYGLSGLALATIMAGCFLILMGFFKAGSLLKYIPKTITIGFTAAIAMGIFTGQLKGFFGFEMGAIPVKVLDKLSAYAQVMDTVQLPALAIGLLAMLILILTPKLAPKIPNSLAAILITTPIALFFLPQTATIRSVYGELPSHFPTLMLPEVNLNMMIDLIPSSLTLAVLIALVSLLACVVTDGLCAQRHDSDQELMGEGIANIFCGLFGAAPVAGAVARASNNVKNGGRTPFAGIFHSLVILLILLFMMPIAGYIPIPTLSAILILVAYNMCSWQEIKIIIKNAPRSDLIVLASTFLAGTFVDLLFAVEIGIILSAIFFMKNMSAAAELKSWEYIPDKNDAENLNLKLVPKHTLVYEIEGPIFFATADSLMDISILQDTKVLILRMRGVPTLEFTALHHLENLYQRCKKSQVTLIFSHVQDEPYSIMSKSGLADKVGSDNYCGCIDEALERAEKLLHNR